MPDDSKRDEDDARPRSTRRRDEPSAGQLSAGNGGGVTDRIRGLLGSRVGGDVEGNGEEPVWEVRGDREGRDPGTALITGCSSGIGRATAFTFLEDDWTVYATARDPDDLAELEEAGCETAALDVQSESQCRRVVERVIDEDGRIDALVNNAGFGLFGPIEEVPTEAVADQFDVNVLGPHRLLRAALPHMREQGRGRIVNVSSVAGRVSFPGAGAYCASKFALEALSDALRAEVDEFGIDVVVIEPGPVETDFEDRAAAETSRLESTGAYSWFDRAFDDYGMFGGGGPGAVSPREVADAVHHAASCPDPDPRYPVGVPASIGGVGRYVPDRWRDRMFGLARRLLG